MLYDILFKVNPSKTLALMHDLITKVKIGTITQEKKNLFVGIRNLGSTCYMNSIIQQFFMIESFKKIILNFPMKNIPATTEVNRI
jgi:ubiquitin C-terminal hydrolase